MERGDGPPGAPIRDGLQGPGLKVKDVIGDSPADRKKSRVEPGEIILSIDGVTVDPSMDLTKVLNGPIDRDIHLLVRDRAGKERTITLRPITYPAANQLLYEQFIKDCRKTVDEASKGRLGYLHIRGMNFPSFHRFEQELYAVGSGKDGLIIDVRNNGGGSTTDHLLTALTQPVHAITVPAEEARDIPRTGRFTRPGTSRSSSSATRTASAMRRSSATRSRP